MASLFDPAALSAAHRTLQLPALALVTNLETGRAVLVRLNDRGPADPGRLIAVSPRAAALLGADAAAPFQVRVQVMEAESRQLAAALAETVPLAVATAPLAKVGTETLAPPAGAPAAAAPPTVAPASPGVAGRDAPASVPLRLPEQVWQGAPAPGMLYIDCGSFTRRQYAGLMAQRLAALGARVLAGTAAPAEAAYRVRIGPLREVAEADAMLARALQGGAADASIVVADD